MEVCYAVDVIDLFHVDGYVVGKLAQDWIPLGVPESASIAVKRILRRVRRLERIGRKDPVGVSKGGLGGLCEGLGSQDNPSILRTSRGGGTNVRTRALVLPMAKTSRKLAVQVG